MNIDTFWGLIKSIDQNSLDNMDDDKAVKPLLMLLSKMSESEIDQFQENLANALYAIDGRKWIDEAGESSDSDDGFLYARCFVVAKGQEFYSKVLSSPNNMPKNSDQWAESLLYVASNAWATITGNDAEDYDEDTTVSYETGSNKLNW